MTQVSPPPQQVAPQRVPAPQPQAPLRHISPPRHFWPHAPQLLRSFATLMQAPLHTRFGEGHWHVCATHPSPGLQALLQVPQFPGLLSSLTQD